MAPDIASIMAGSFWEILVTGISDLTRLGLAARFLRFDAMDFRLDVGQQFSSNHAKQKGAGLFRFFSHGSVNGSMHTRKVEIVIHAG